MSVVSFWDLRFRFRVRERLIWTFGLGTVVNLGYGFSVLGRQYRSSLWQLIVLVALMASMPKGIVTEW